MSNHYLIEMFYDGDCPLCMREKRLLERKDSHSRIKFTNIAAPDFDAQSFGKSHDEFMAEMHGRLPDGTWVTGVEAFRHLYSAVGLGQVMKLTRLPVIRQCLGVGYYLFAKHRLRLTGRCNEACSVDLNRAAG